MFPVGPQNQYPPSSIGAQYRVASSYRKQSDYRVVISSPQLMTAPPEALEEDLLLLGLTYIRYFSGVVVCGAMHLAEPSAPPSGYQSKALCQPRHFHSSVRKTPGQA